MQIAWYMPYKGFSDFKQFSDVAGFCWKFVSPFTTFYACWVIQCIKFALKSTVVNLKKKCFFVDWINPLNFLEYAEKTSLYLKEIFFLKFRAHLKRLYMPNESLLISDGRSNLFTLHILLEKCLCSKHYQTKIWGWKWCESFHHCRQETKFNNEFGNRII